MRAQWFSEARFGMFIHWGLYSIPGGIWRGREMSYIGEWLQACFRIPNREYGALAARFNPERFDAEQWCRTARDAGMRYLVFSAKHHDGFAMYRSRVDSYNVVDATPFGRDPLAELAAACPKYGLKLGIYYSQDLDWHHPDGGDPGPESPKNHGMSWGNDWDYPAHRGKRFRRYFEGKAIPQLTELLTGYGPVGIMWFDCPLTISREESGRIVELVRKLQPDCLINTRIGHGFGDYGSYGDNQLPAAPPEGMWETPGTLNRTWGFKWNDHDWKTPGEVLSLLASLAEKDTNYLLNVGPMPDGSFPPETVRVLRETGKWLERYGFAVYGCGANPFQCSFDWGYVTVEQRPGKRTRLHLIIREFRPEIRLYGLEEVVFRCWAAAEPECPVEFGCSGGRCLTIRLPERLRARLLPVVTLELACRNAPAVCTDLVPLDHVLRLPAARGTIRHGQREAAVEPAELRGLGAAGERHPAVSHCCLDRTGNLAEWHNPADRIEWEAYFPEEGRYRVEVVTVSGIHGAAWKTGQKVELAVSGDGGAANVLVATLNGRPDPSASDRCYIRGSAEAGTLSLNGAGRRKISLRMLDCPDREALAMTLAELRLVRL